MSSDAVEVRLSRGLVALIDPCDAERVLTKNWCAHPRRATTGGWYAKSRFGPKKIYLHRFIMQPPEGVIVDHVNGDGLDCRRANLRLADLTANAINRRYDKDGYRGVRTTRGGRFLAILTFRGRRYRSSTYLSEVAAARAYDAMARSIHGEFAVLNFGSASC